MRTVVVGASSGLGRCIGIGLAQRGAKTALLARRLERLEGPPDGVEFSHFRAARGAGTYRCQPAACQWGIYGRALACELCGAGVGVNVRHDTSPSTLPCLVVL